MSLISEALKEAQREHSVRKGQSATVARVDNFFPYPSSKKRRRPNVALLVGAVAVVAIAAAAATYALVRLTRANTARAIPALIASSPGNVVGSTNPSSALPRQPSTNVAAAIVIPTAPPATAAGPPGRVPQRSGVVPDAPVRASAPIAQSASQAAAPARGAPVPSVAKTPTLLGDSAIAGTGTAPRPSITPLSDGGVRIVVDRAGSRPADSLFQLAYAEHVRNNFVAAQELYERVIALPQAPAGAFNNYGALLAKRGNQAGAREMFQQTLTRDPENVDAWINLGDSYNAVGHHGEAMAAFARAMQIDPASSAVKIRLATEYRAIGDTGSARRMYEEASKLAPRDPTVHHSYAEFLQSQHDIRGAIREYQQFVDLAPGVFGPDTIDGVKLYIASLRRLVP